MFGNFFGKLFFQFFGKIFRQFYVLFFLAQIFFIFILFFICAMRRNVRRKKRRVTRNNLNKQNGLEKISIQFVPYGDPKHFLIFSTYDIDTPLAEG